MTRLRGRALAVERGDFFTKRKHGAGVVRSHGLSICQGHFRMPPLDDEIGQHGPQKSACLNSPYLPVPDRLVAASTTKTEPSIATQRHQQPVRQRLTGIADRNPQLPSVPVSRAVAPAETDRTFAVYDASSIGRNVNRQRERLGFSRSPRFPGSGSGMTASPASPLVGSHALAAVGLRAWGWIRSTARAQRIGVRWSRHKVMILQREHTATGMWPQLQYPVIKAGEPRPYGL